MTADIAFTEEGHLGIVTLNRPQALNALTLDMIKALQQQLLCWEKENSIHAVIVRAEGGKAFCAGGDIRRLYETGRNGEDKMSFFWHEYRLNHYIHQFSKPYIPLMDGITMGGGVGISLHGSHPIATQNFSFAMPETGIGFFPDIGASYLLSRCPGAMGIYLGLTGNRLSAEEAKALGLVKEVVAADRQETILEQLLTIDLSTNASEKVTATLRKFALPLEEFALKDEQQAINTCFALNTVEKIYAALEQRDDEWATNVLCNLEKKSPLSLKITLAQILKAEFLSLKECLEMDYCLVSHFMRDHDFYEGVRALLVDKDKRPHWQPENLSLVSDTKVAGYFECNEQLFF
ncbi:enoyl-CoA hydratase/isomerase family protein [Legionella fairfieldensis]|uniref:enoyl-CoA hydratase/isomerase family protein n=1 Tax=Legionella fairfieldensis TaxID=45064 RepID=UPI000491AA43|nr:enoyl-CoA hydratase/isomerase family protein [Legionella fairfieldensis]